MPARPGLGHQGGTFRLNRTSHEGPAFCHAPTLLVCLREETDASEELPVLAKKLPDTHTRHCFLWGGQLVPPQRTGGDRTWAQDTER